MPAAVAAARPGDTVRCQQWPPFQVFTAPVIKRGLTLDGGGANGLVGKTTITGIPSGETVTVLDFVAPPDKPFNFRIVDCLGHVHLDGLATSTAASKVSPRTSIEILRSTAVTLHTVATHGSPAVSIVDSFVTLDHCRFGTRAGGNLAGGRCVKGLRSTISITQPEMDAGNVAISTVFVDQCKLTIAGKWRVGGSGSINGGSPGSSLFPALEGRNSNLTLAPTIATRGSITGFAPLTMRTRIYHQVHTPRQGRTASLSSFGPTAAIGIGALSPPVTPTPSLFGDIWVDQATLATYPFALDNAGKHQLHVTIPASIPIGTTLTLQAFVFVGGGLELALPTTFSIRN